MNFWSFLTRLGDKHDEQISSCFSTPQAGQSSRFCRDFAVSLTIFSIFSRPHYKTPNLTVFWEISLWNVWQDFRITPYINYAYICCLKKTKDSTLLIFLKYIFEFFINKAPPASNSVTGRISWAETLKIINLTSMFNIWCRSAKDVAMTLNVNGLRFDSHWSEFFLIFRFAFVFLV